MAAATAKKAAALEEKAKKRADNVVELARIENDIKQKANTAKNSGIHPTLSKITQKMQRPVASNKIPSEDEAIGDKEVGDNQDLVSTHLYIDLSLTDVFRWKTRALELCRAKLVVGFPAHTTMVPTRT